MIGDQRWCILEQGLAFLAREWDDLDEPTWEDLIFFDIPGLGKRGGVTTDPRPVGLAKKVCTSAGNAKICFDK
jgi:hypothetical protein